MFKFSWKTHLVHQSCYSSFHSLSYLSTVRSIELGIGLIELGIGLRINNARRTVLARVSGLVSRQLIKKVLVILGAKECWSLTKKEFSCLGKDREATTVRQTDGGMDVLERLTNDRNLPIWTMESTKNQVKHDGSFKRYMTDPPIDVRTRVHKHNLIQTSWKGFRLLRLLSQCQICIHPFRT